MAATIHVRFAGRSIDIPLSQLGVSPFASDADIKRALADYLEEPAARFSDHIIDRHSTGNLTLRPQAVFG